MRDKTLGLFGKCQRNVVPQKIADKKFGKKATFPRIGDY